MVSVVNLQEGCHHVRVLKSLKKNMTDASLDIEAKRINGLHNNGLNKVNVLFFFFLNKPPAHSGST